MSKWLTLKRLEEMCQEARIMRKKDDHLIKLFDHTLQDYHLLNEEDLMV